jgi:hypothetical protein
MDGDYCQLATKGSVRLGHGVLQAESDYDL